MTHDLPPSSHPHRRAIRRAAAVALFLAVGTGLAACEDYPEYTNLQPSSSAGAAGAAGSTGAGGTSGGVSGAPAAIDDDGPIIEVPGGDAGAAGAPPDVPDDRVCGNGVRESAEICDDGNTDDGDGCSGDCREQDPDFICSEPGELCVDGVVCGNGVLEGDEVCDEGSANATDGCSDDCLEVSDGYSCPRPGRACVELPVCGNGVRERGEQCDDDNSDDDDGCSARCEEEEGYFCVPGEACVPLVCGDGERTLDEGCDDGNADDDDGCSSDCEPEEGFRCSTLGCSPICGDGLVRGGEACDDDNRESGDGCSASCKVEPYFSCDDSEPSDCSSTISCGNGELEPGEICDPGVAGSETCIATGSSACRDFDTGLVDTAECGNSVIEYREECDGDNGEGCTDDCELEEGFACPRADYCYRVPSCGDGLVQLGERCDVGAMSSEACVDCAVQDGWYCTGSAPSLCEPSVCGDGEVAPNEPCDESSPGCVDCEIQPGWACPPGVGCQPRCGDGLVVGGEECETTTGCTNCRIDPGYDCDADGLSCALTDCGDGTREAGEGCDDGNTVAGDGCGPTCQLEPTVDVGPDPHVNKICGDGLRMADEECDDGNTSNGDGCDDSCDEEPGWYCEDQLTLPEDVQLKIKYRDFKQRVDEGGHPHMKVGGDGFPPSGLEYGITGGRCDAGDTAADCGRLDAQGKPELRGDGTIPTTIGDHVDAFALWYRSNNAADLAGEDGVIQIEDMGEDDAITLTQVGSSDTYVFESADNDFYPLDGEGLGDLTANGVVHNWHFTSEMRYFFQYRAGQELRFFGDDDVWVYVNGRLAVDIGGIHSTAHGRVVLGDEDWSCAANPAAEPYDDPDCAPSAAELQDPTDDRFGITQGGVYEIVVFQAERHPNDSNYRLTLSGFLAPRSFCSTDCGDGIAAGNELCDDGDDNADGEYGVCSTSCDFVFCGDGDTQTSDEACDDGLNITVWEQSLSGACAPGCQDPSYCGDGILQPAYELCDDGVNDASYGGCDDCQALGPYCGDGEVQEEAGEECDDPDGFTNYGGCGYDCKIAPYCGDGIRNGAEQCDGGENCRSDCKYEPFCGDGLTDPESEDCDYGPFGYSGDPADAPYGGCTLACEYGPLCGDGVVHSIEECDDGEDNADGAYDGCSADCTFGPHCGDEIVQSEQGESCDNGYNEDVYAFTEDACGAGCKAVPYCGDGDLQAAYELCDNGDDNDNDAYNGCTLSCEYGPYCGDGEVQQSYEDCDDGADNVAYEADGTGCSYDCKVAPYCGDGVRNGSERCDDGTEANDGSYGGCKEDCTLAPFCGDRRVQRDEGEECDDGPTGSFNCTASCEIRNPIVN